MKYIKLIDKKPKLANRYVIVAVCDPYHANLKIWGGDVIRRDMATVTSWVSDDAYGCGYTMDEALREIKSIVYNGCDKVWEDRSSAEEFMKSVAEDNDEVYDGSLPDWFDGDGVYCDGVKLYSDGDTSYRDDAILYRIELADDVYVEADNCSNGCEAEE